LVSIFHPKPACDLSEIRVQEVKPMEILYPNCAGGDVHLKTVVVCAVWRENGRRRQATRTFGTTTGELLQLADWLVAQGITHMALESTGVYWKPVYYVLESQLEVWLVNAQHVKKVPGRKTDVSDAEWLAAVMECGLVRASFVPPPSQRELRDLTRNWRRWSATSMACRPWPCCGSWLRGSPTHPLWRAWHAGVCVRSALNWKPP
jgi:hypothetical protein